VAQTPKHDLISVQALIRRGVADSIWFSAPSRSLNEVVRVYSGTDTPKSLAEAADFICAGILELTPRHFVERVLQWEVVADVYGIIYDHRPWYVKFVLDDGVLEEISFHPPEKALKTVGGLQIPTETKK
jgi:hypothetical protein